MTACRWRAFAVGYADRAWAEAVIEAIEPVAPSPPTPTPAHIELLRLRPDKADAFDARFGVGAAAKFLGR